MSKKPNRRGKPLVDMRYPCQIEKDERFWIATCLMTVFYSERRVQELCKLFEKAFGSFPPINGISTWVECFEGNLHLFFETNLPSPESYKQWLKKNLTNHQFIPYILESAEGKKKPLEGATNVDAMFLNPQNGFSTIIEAKVLSDISYQVTYDVIRNQIARNIDVMMEKNDDLCPPLIRRDPEKTLFLLITPQLFKDNPSTRLYGYKFNDYKNYPENISNDLPHRKNCDWKTVSDRLGWLTWEDFKNTNKACYP